MLRQKGTEGVGFGYGRRVFKIWAKGVAGLQAKEEAGDDRADRIWMMMVYLDLCNRSLFIHP